MDWFSEPAYLSKSKRTPLKAGAKIHILFCNKQAFFELNFNFLYVSVFMHLTSYYFSLIIHELTQMGLEL